MTQLLSLIPVVNIILYQLQGYVNNAFNEEAVCENFTNTLSRCLPCSVARDTDKKVYKYLGALRSRLKKNVYRLAGYLFCIAKSLLLYLAQSNFRQFNMFFLFTWFKI